MPHSLENTTYPLENTLQSECKTIWDYDRLDVDGLIGRLMDADWEAILDRDIDSATEQFTSAISTAAKETIPTKILRTKRKDKPWMTNELKRNIRKRDRLFKQAKRTNNYVDWERWRNQRNIVTSMNRRLRQSHLQLQIHKLLEN